MCFVTACPTIAIMEQFSNMELKTNFQRPIRPLALAHLTLLGVAPPQLADIAAQSGFTHIGVRVVAATNNEVRYDLTPHSPLLRDTQKALAYNGISVLDIEALSLSETTTAETWLPALEAGASLGATVFNVIGFDSDLDRMSDTFSALAADAITFGIRASLEPISYRALSTLALAEPIVERTQAGGIMLDTLHFQRAGSTPADIDAIAPHLFTVVQLCDGPAAVPTDISIPEYSPMGVTVDSTPRSIEARVQRELPGDGTFPLTAILNKVPADVPISVEVPNPVLIREIGAVEFAHRAYQSAAALLEQDLVT